MPPAEEMASPAAPGAPVPMSDGEGSSPRAMERRAALFCVIAAAASVAVGVVVAARNYPGGFDWAYTVISRLASNRRNPDGARWLSGFFLLGMVLLWPVAGHLKQRFDLSGWRRSLPLLGLRIGLLGGMILGLEGLFALDLSALGRKAHEAVAIVAFFGFYAGVLGLYGLRGRGNGASVWPALVVAAPLVAVGITQLALYFDQRDLGWVNTEWRELGVPLVLSFAFWQWVAVVLLGAGLALLVAAGDPEPEPAPSPPPRPSAPKEPNT
jgi:hypothetical protein